MSSVTRDPDPLVDLYTGHHGWLVGWLRRKLGCPDRAADIAQDTVLRILLSRDALFAMREPRAFLTTTANRLLIDQTRRQAVEQAYLAELMLAGEQQAGAPSPEELLIAAQALGQIAVALEKVSAKAAEAFLLHYLDGVGHAGIAERQGVSTRMVRKYLVQCLLHCADLLPARHGS